MSADAVKRIRTAVSAGLAALVLSIPAPASAQGAAAAAAADPAARPLAIGHRGAAGLAPENTLAAFARACALGVDALELDVLATADGEIVVHHDFRLKPEIARKADGSRISGFAPPAIKDLSLSEIKTYDVGRLDAGSEYGRRYPEQVPADGERIPTLAEVVRLMRTACSEPTRLLVEIKTSPEEPGMTPAPEALAEKVVQLLRAEGAAGRSLVLSFDWRNLVHVQKIAPELPTVYLTLTGRGLDNLKPGQPGASPWTAGIDVDDVGGSAPRAVKAAGGTIWAPHFSQLDSRTLAEARALGLKVYVWTVDKPEDMLRMIALKVDGIISNRPDLLKKALSGE
jgi:glycerophosphoryl diester phosphodiesterase